MSRKKENESSKKTATFSENRGWGKPDPDLFVDFGPDNWEPFGSTVVLRNVRPELAEYTPEIRIPDHIISVNASDFCKKNNRVIRNKQKDNFCNLFCPIPKHFSTIIKEECRRLWGPDVTYFLGNVRIPIEKREFIEKVNRLESICNIQVLLADLPDFFGFQDTNEDILKKIQHLISYVPWGHALETWAIFQQKPEWWNPEEIYTSWKLQPTLEVECDRIITEGSDTQHSFNTQDVIECFEEHACKFLDWSFNPKVWQRDREFYLKQNQLKENEESSLTTNTNIDEKRPDLTFKIVIFDSSLSLFIDLSRTKLMRQCVDIKGNSLLNSATCNLILKYVRIRPKDTICDPMCGHGGIVKALLNKYPLLTIKAGDVDNTCVEKTKENIKDLKNSEKVDIKVWDAANLPLDENSLDMIITEFPSSKNIDNRSAYKIYESVLNSFARVIKRDGGRTIIISPYSTILDEIIGKSLYWQNLDRQHIPWTVPKINFYILNRNVEIYDDKKLNTEISKFNEEKQFHSSHSSEPLPSSLKRGPVSGQRKPLHEQYPQKYLPSNPCVISHSDRKNQPSFTNRHSKNDQCINYGSKRNYDQKFENMNKRNEHGNYRNGNEYENFGKGNEQENYGRRVGYKNYDNYDNRNQYNNYDNRNRCDNYDNYDNRYGNYDNRNQYNNYGNRNRCDNYDNYDNRYDNYDNRNQYNNYDNYDSRYDNYANKDGNNSYNNKSACINYNNRNDYDNHDQRLNTEKRNYRDQREGNRINRNEGYGYSQGCNQNRRENYGWNEYGKNNYGQKIPPKSHYYQNKQPYQNGMNDGYMKTNYNEKRCNSQENLNTDDDLYNQIRNESIYKKVLNKENKSMREPLRENFRQPYLKKQQG